jgi:hypothetical protein
LVFCSSTTSYFSGKDHILKDHRGRQFIIGFPKQFRNSGSLDIYIASRELSTANITADGYFDSLTLQPNLVTHVSLPKRLLMSQGKENNGILIESDSEIAVYGLNQIERTTDAFLGLPVDILGTRYLAVGSDPSSNIGIQYLNVLSVIATQDNTTVTISPKSRLLIGRQGFRRIYHPYDKPLVFKLNRLESYTIRSVSDITGSLIESDKAISVISGHECAYVPDPYRYCDHLIEQVGILLVLMGLFKYLLSMLKLLRSFL